MTDKQEDQKIKMSGEIAQTCLIKSIQSIKKAETLSFSNGCVSNNLEYNRETVHRIGISLAWIVYCRGKMVVVDGLLLLLAECVASKVIWTLNRSETHRTLLKDCVIFCFLD